MLWREKLAGKPQLHSPRFSGSKFDTEQDGCVVYNVCIHVDQAFSPARQQLTGMTIMVTSHARRCCCTKERTRARCLRSPSPWMSTNTSPAPGTSVLVDQQQHHSLCCWHASSSDHVRQPPQPPLAAHRTARAHPACPVHLVVATALRSIAALALC